jgi:hypothetical protein
MSQVRQLVIISTEKDRLNWQRYDYELIDPGNEFWQAVKVDQDSKSNGRPSQQQHAD